MRPHTRAFQRFADLQAFDTCRHRNLFFFYTLQFYINVLRITSTTYMSLCRLCQCENLQKARS